MDHQQRSPPQERVPTPADAEAYAGFIHREIVQLVVLGVIAVVAFLVTHAAATANREQRQRDAASWYATAQHARAGGRMEAAIDALRHATAIAHDRVDYRLALASTLAAHHDDGAARQVLLGVRESTPEDPEVNTQLARLEDRANDSAAAIRYYHAALYGAWEGDGVAKRRALRLELVRSLLRRQLKGRALSELLILVGNIPDDITSHNELGDLLGRAGDSRLALEQFRRTLQLDPRDTVALTGGARATIETNDYTSALRYLRRLPHEVFVSTPELVDLRTIAEIVVERDPLSRGLGIVERQRRLAFGVAIAAARLAACGSVPNDQAQDSDLPAIARTMRALQADLSRARIRDRDAIEDGVVLVARTERLTSGCAPVTPVDRALLLIGGRLEAEQR